MNAQRLRDIANEKFYGNDRDAQELAVMVLVAQTILHEWAQKEGHALCHQHPEILMRLAHALDVPVKQNPPLPERCDFETGCREYHDFLYGAEKASEA